MRILRAVKAACCGCSSANALAAANLRARPQPPAWRRNGWCSRGGCRWRSIFARHRLADLFLDTLPYNAHTTASDALWAGLPVLTCLGETFPGRVAASLLHA